MVSVFLSRLPWTRMILVVGQYAWVGVSEPFGRRGSVSFLDVVILVLWTRGEGEGERFISMGET